MSNLEKTFEALRKKREGAFMPFLVIGDPTFEQSLEATSALIRGGADLLEFGLAFSDPPADGPVIQNAGKRALAAGITTARAFEFLARVRAMTDAPIALLLYYNLVLSAGVTDFYRRARAAGVDAILVADVPVEESEVVTAAAEAHGIAPIFIVSELTTPARLDQIARKARGYIYVVARVGVTGERAELATGLAQLLGDIKARTRLPLLAGFGLSRPDHVTAVMGAGADGVIVGSAVVQRVEHNIKDTKAMVNELESFARSMKAATKAV